MAGHGGMGRQDMVSCTIRGRAVCKGRSVTETEEKGTPSLMVRPGCGWGSSWAHFEKEDSPCHPSIRSKSCAAACSKTAPGCYQKRPAAASGGVWRLPVLPFNRSLRPHL